MTASKALVGNILPQATGGLLNTFQSKNGIRVGDLDMQDANAIVPKLDGSSNDAKSGFDSNNFVFAMNGLIAVVIFLNLCLCLFIGWRKRIKRWREYKSYNIVETIDS